MASFINRSLPFHQVNVSEKVKEICTNKKNVNIIQEYLKELEETDNEERFLESLNILKDVYSFYIRNDNLLEKHPVEHPLTAHSDLVDIEDVVEKWLQSSFKGFVGILIQRISSCNNDTTPSTSSITMQVQSLKALMHVFQVQYSHMILLQTNKSTKKLNFPNQMFMNIIKCLIFNADISEKLMAVIKDEIIEFDDNRYYFMKNIHSLIRQEEKVFVSKNDEKGREKIIGNIFSLLLLVAKKEFPESDMKFYFGSLTQDSSLDTGYILKSYTNVFSSAWLSLMRIPNLSSEIHKKILINLDTKIIPQLSDPKLLIDFLTDSYDVGGVISLLALNGLFILINQHNLDYPDFYEKLYNLLEPKIFLVQYKARFFQLLDLFLSSSHLPAYLVAAFVKRLSRLSLFMPAPDLPMLLTFVRNILIRHPSSRILIHRNMAQSSIESDPFLYFEPNPSKCEALKSCLWELNTLKSHFSSDVLKSVKSFTKEFPKYEEDLPDDFMAATYELLFTAKMKEDSDSIPPINFMKDSKIFSDIDNDMWIVE